MRRHIYRKPLIDAEDKFPPCFGYYSAKNYACKICLLSRERKQKGTNPVIDELRKRAEALALRHLNDARFRREVLEKFGIKHLTPEGLKKFSRRYVICGYRKGLAKIKEEV